MTGHGGGIPEAGVGFKADRAQHYKNKNVLTLYFYVVISQQKAICCT